MSRNKGKSVSQIMKKVKFKQANNNVQRFTSTRGNVKRK